jgi:hypothetical protein
MDIKKFNSPVSIIIFNIPLLFLILMVGEQRTQYPLPYVGE